MTAITPRPLVGRGFFVPPSVIFCFFHEPLLSMRVLISVTLDKALPVSRETITLVAYAYY